MSLERVIMMYVNVLFDLGFIVVPVLFARRKLGIDNMSVVNIILHVLMAYGLISIIKFF